MLDFPVYMGVNAPKEHQRVIAKLTAGLYVLYQHGKIPLEALPETMINESGTSPTPDILLYDNVMLNNVALIEISSADNFKKDFKKIVALVEDYEVSEGFIYDYQRKLWKKYKLGIGEITENPSFCDAIGYDLNDFLK
jgi:hypothetical protein